VVALITEALHKHTVELFFIASAMPRGLSARFQYASGTTEQLEAKPSQNRNERKERQKDSSETEQKQCQEWHLCRRERPHKENVQDKSAS